MRLQWIDLFIVFSFVDWKNPKRPTENQTYSVLDSFLQFLLFAFNILNHFELAKDVWIMRVHSKRRNAVGWPSTTNRLRIKSNRKTRTREETATKIDRNKTLQSCVHLIFINIYATPKKVKSLDDAVYLFILDFIVVYRRFVHRICEWQQPHDISIRTSHRQKHHLHRRRLVSEWKRDGIIRGQESGFARWILSISFLGVLSSVVANGIAQNRLYIKVLFDCFVSVSPSVGLSHLWPMNSAIN